MTALDLLDVACVLGAIAKVAPDLTPLGSFTPAEVDIEVPDYVTAVRVASILSDARRVRSTPIHDGGYVGAIADIPVRILATPRMRGRGRAA